MDNSVLAMFNSKPSMKAKNKREPSIAISLKGMC